MPLDPQVFAVAFEESDGERAVVDAPQDRSAASIDQIVAKVRMPFRQPAEYLNDPHDLRSVAQADDQFSLRSRPAGCPRCV